jgi:hypothetical protein
MLPPSPADNTTMSGLGVSSFLYIRVIKIIPAINNDND